MSVAQAKTSDKVTKTETWQGTTDDRSQKLEERIARSELLVSTVTNLEDDGS